MAPPEADFDSLDNRTFIKDHLQKHAEAIEEVTRIATSYELACTPPLAAGKLILASGGGPPRSLESTTLVLALTTALSRIRSPLAPLTWKNAEGLPGIYTC